MPSRSPKGGEASPTTDVEPERKLVATSLSVEQIYKQMTMDELAKGPMSYRRRRQFMRYAKKVGIEPFRASLLIAEARREAGLAEDPKLVTAEEVAADEWSAILNPERWPFWFKLSSALTAAALVDLLVIRAIGW